VVLQLGGFGVRLTTSHCKTIFVHKHHTGPRNWVGDLERPQQREWKKVGVLSNLNRYTYRKETFRKA
jgi:hypothetical protein